METNGVHRALIDHRVGMDILSAHDKLLTFDGFDFEINLLSMLAMTVTGVFFVHAPGLWDDSADVVNQELLHIGTVNLRRLHLTGCLEHIRCLM